MADNDKPALPAVPNPVELARLYGDIARKSGEMMTRFMQRPRTAGAIDPDEMGLGQAFFEAWARLLANPAKLAEAQMKLWQDYANLWQSSLRKLMWQPAQPAIEPAKGDRRFRHEDWQQLFAVRLHQAVLPDRRQAPARHARPGGGARRAHRSGRSTSITRQYIDALAPTNFVLTNPEVLRETIASGGQNLLKGLNNLLDDLERGGGQLRISDDRREGLQARREHRDHPRQGRLPERADAADPVRRRRRSRCTGGRCSSFRPGSTSTTSSICARTIRFVRWAVEQGHTVFIVSWVNPDEAMRGQELRRLPDRGHARRAGRDRAGDRREGASTSSATASAARCSRRRSAIWRRRSRRARRRVTFFVVASSTSRRPGELEVFIDEEQVAALEKRMNEHGGYLEGSEMANTFNMLRSNDLIWSFVVNNYLLGTRPVPVRPAVLELRLDAHAGGDAQLLPAQHVPEEPAEASRAASRWTAFRSTWRRSTMPPYFVSTLEDHIAPWQTDYAGAEALPGPSRFMLGGSGHIAGMVNPPAANKYRYWTNDKLPADARGVAAERAAACRLVVDRLGPVDCGARRGKVPARVRAKAS